MLVVIHIDKPVYGNGTSEEEMSVVTFAQVYRFRTFTTDAVKQTYMVYGGMVPGDGLGVLCGGTIFSQFKSCSHMDGVILGMIM